jgi:hypothetical protein
MKRESLSLGLMRVTLRLKPEIHERLYTLSFVRRQSINAVINDLLDEATKKASDLALGKQSDAFQK